MGTSISALLIISVLLTAVVVMFKANQIGAELLAVANKSAAETIADRVSTKIEISSTQDFKDSYKEEKKHHLQDTEGCRPILPGIPRSGDITTTNSLDCYWFHADSQAEVTLTVNKVIGSPVPLANRTGTNTKISVDYFPPGEVITATNASANKYKDLTNTTLRGQLVDLVSESSTEASPHRIKMWSYAGQVSANLGGYQVLITIGGAPAADLSTVACVTDFKIKNSGGTAFSSTQMEEKLDVFVVLNTAAGATDMKVPVKGNAPLQSSQWAYSISDDNYQVGIFNPGETITMTINLNDEPQVAGTLLITLPNGVGTSYSFPSICAM